LNVVWDEERRKQGVAGEARWLRRRRGCSAGELIGRGSLCRLSREPVKRASLSDKKKKKKKRSGLPAAPAAHTLMMPARMQLWEDGVRI